MPENSLMSFDAEAAVLNDAPRSDAREAAPPRPAPARRALLMCAPDHFGVDYIINPWMENQIGQAALPRAKAQWENLRGKLAAHSDIAFVAPTPGLPDMVFTANAGLAIGDTAVVSRFTPRSAGPKSVCFANGSKRKAIRSRPGRRTFRSRAPATRSSITRGELSGADTAGAQAKKRPSILKRSSAVRAVALRLVDPRFYHLDTCFCPLSGGWLMYYPEAFDIASREAIRAIAPVEKRIEVGEKDALSFACNAVEVAGRVFLNACSDDLRSRLIDAGFTPVVTPLSEFMKAGGAAKCLTLQLPGAASAVMPRG